MAWPPDVSQLESLLEGAGVDYGTLDLQEAMDSATAAFERMTGWAPFYATEAEYFFDPPGRAYAPAGLAGGGFVLNLQKGLLSLDGVRVNGIHLVANRDFFLWGEAPYTFIRFARPVWGLPQSVKVEGIWGYTGDPVPADIVEAVVRLAGAEIVQALSQGQAFNPAEWSEKDVRERYSIELLAKIGEPWEKLAMATARRIQKLWV